MGAPALARIIGRMHEPDIPPDNPSAPVDKPIEGREDDVEISPQRRRVFIIATLGFFLVLAAFIVRFMLPAYSGRITAHWHGSIIYDEQDQRVPRANTSYPYKMCSLADETDCREYVMRHVEHGIIRTEPVGPHPGRPLVLLIGDSHMYGFNDPTQNTDHLLEQQLRSHPALMNATVLNASCQSYSLFEYVVRARSLWDEYGPDMLLVVIHVGNDLVELEDVHRPHLDDRLREQPTNWDPPAERTTDRSKLFKQYVDTERNGWFQQGMNQSIYFLREPERYPITLAKARRSIELLQELCREKQAKLLIAMLPAYIDLIDYEVPFAIEPPLSGILEMKIQRRARSDLHEICQEAGVNTIDLFSILHVDHPAELYCADLHVWVPGHKIIAETLEPLVSEILLKRP